jgi:hypothetical protein
LKNREDVVATIDALLAGLKKNPESWENPTLEGYLEAMAAWVHDWGRKYDPPPSWEFIIQMLNAAESTNDTLPFCAQIVED